MTNWVLHAAWIDLFLSGQSGAALLIGPAQECLAASPELLALLKVEASESNRPLAFGASVLFQGFFDPKAHQEFDLFVKESGGGSKKISPLLCGSSLDLEFTRDEVMVPGLRGVRLIRIHSDRADSDNQRLELSLTLLRELAETAAQCRSRESLIECFLNRMVQYFDGGCVLYDLDPQGRATILKAAHSDPVVIESLNKALDNPTLIERLGYRGVMTLPITCGESRYGSLLFFSSLREFDSLDFNLARTLLSMLAMGLASGDRVSEIAHSLCIRDELLSFSSHEVRTPLTSLKLLMELLVQLVENPDRFSSSKDRVMGVVKNSAIQLDQTIALLEQLLEFSRIDAGEISIRSEPFSLRAVVDEVQALLRLQLERDRVVIRVLADDDGWVLGDSIRIRQLLLNLVTNAVKYGHGPEVVVGMERRGEWIQMRVIDYGDGVSPELRERIFQPFDRGLKKSDGLGHGLGLFIAKKFVEAHGGRIWVEPSAPRGATFVVELPAGVAPSIPNTF